MLKIDCTESQNSQKSLRQASKNRKKGVSFKLMEVRDRYVDK